MKEVAQLLGVELEEEFKIKTDEGTILKETFVISEAGLQEKPSGNPYSYALMELLVGDFEIIKLPFKPKRDERYYCFVEDGVGRFGWSDASFDYAMYKLGNCFRTKEEAETKGKEIMEQIVKEFEDE